jgi:hypothetical protein
VIESLLAAEAELVDEVVAELEQLGLDLVVTAGVVRDHADGVDHRGLPFRVELDWSRGTDSFERIYGAARGLEEEQLVENRFASSPRDFNDAIASRDLDAVEALGHRPEAIA